MTYIGKTNIDQLKTSISLSDGTLFFFAYFVESRTVFPVFPHGKSGAGGAGRKRERDFAKMLRGSA